jgi:hypothetical protein
LLFQINKELRKKTKKGNLEVILIVEDGVTNILNTVINNYMIAVYRNSNDDVTP